MTAALPKDSGLNLMKRLAKDYIRPYTGLMLLALVFMAVAAAATAGIAQLIQPVLDEVLSGTNAAVIIPIGLLVLGTFAARGISTYLHTVIMNKIGQSIVADIQRDLFGHLMKLDLAFYHANPSGQLISRVINDVSVMRIAVSESATAFGKSLLTLIFLVGVMIYQDWKLSIMAFTIMPIASGTVFFVGRRLRHVSRNIQDETAYLSDRLSQIFQGIRQVMAYGMEGHEAARAGTAINKVAKLNMKSVRISNMLTPVNEILIGIVACAIIIYGGFQVSAGTMTAGQLISFLAAFTMAYEPMKRLARLNNSVQMALGAALRVFEMMDTPPVIADRENAIALKSEKPEVVFKDVEFQYEDGDIKAINGISFTAKAGAVTALVGPSGGGKTTIINLIPRFYDIYSGVVSVGGHDVRDLTLESLRQNIGLVSQDITIFDDTIATNIAYSRPDATESEIRAAAKAAAADEFISAFPDGYRTRVGEDGVKLSGGQRQRIAIARAILRDAPILLLDEATSALDNESEKAVRGALEELEKGRTTIVIAHRLSTVQTADKIIVLDKGKIAEQGTHEELMAKGGVYEKMYRAGFRD